MRPRAHALVSTLPAHMHAASAHGQAGLSTHLQAVKTGRRRTVIFQRTVDLERLVKQLYGQLRVAVVEVRRAHVMQAFCLAPLVAQLPKDAQPEVV